MLAYNPADRISMENIKQHPWLLETIATSEETQSFLSAALPDSEIGSNDKGNNMNGYRSPYSDDELPLSRNSSRNLVL